MIVSDRKRRLTVAKSISDIQQGDFVRRALGSRKVGIVESQSDGWAWIAWSSERRDYLPLCAVRKVQPKGHDFDARRK